MSELITVSRTGDVVRVVTVGVRGPAGDAGEGGGVDSVNGETGVVVLTASDVGADASGSAAAVAATAAAGDVAVASAAAGALASHEADTTSIHGIADTSVLATTTSVAAAVTAHSAATDPHADRAFTTSAISTHAGASDPHGDRAYAAGLVDDLSGVTDASAARTALGLGTAATQASGAFDPAGSAAAAQAAAIAASQPLDSDLTAIAALTTTSFGRALLALADAAAGRTALGLGTAALSASGDFQPVDSDLTAIAALSTTSFGRSVLALADAAALRTLAGVVIGTDVQAYDSELAALAGLTSAADRLPYFTGSGTAALATYTAAARTWDAYTTAAAQLAGLSGAATASFAMNSQKITGLAAGTTAGDAVRYEQLADYTPHNSGIRMPGIPRTNIPDSTGSVVAIGAANRAVYQRVDGAGTITKIGFNVGTSSGNVSAATCTGTAGRSVTVTRSGTSGAVACPAAGYAEVTLGSATAVTSNDWMAISADNNTATFRRNLSGTFGIGTNLCLGFSGYENTAHPVPATPTIVTDSVPPYTLIGVP